jgi:hypothetical protein
MKKNIFKTLCMLFILSMVSTFSMCFNSKTDDPPEYTGTIYNALNGTCTLAGRSLDYYFNGTFIATLASGSNTTKTLQEGAYTITVYTTSDHVYRTTYNMNIVGNNWWFWYGCADGTHPSIVTKDTIINNDSCNADSFSPIEEE